MATLRSLLLEYVARLDTAGVDSPRLSAEVLMAHTMGMTRQELVKELLMTPDREIDDGVARDLIARRERGEPVAYITGVKEFYGRDFSVNQATLIPRPDTETLVDAAISFARSHTDTAPPRFIDMGTGSGAIAVTLALELPHWDGVAVDISPEALTMAENNAEKLGAGNLRFLLHDFLAPDLPAGPYTLITANPPYVSEAEYAELPLEVKGFEPRSALVPDGHDASGLEHLRAIMDAAPRLLVSGGLLLMEMGCTQGDALLRHAADAGQAWRDVSILRDLAGLPRVFSAVRT